MKTGEMERSYLKANCDALLITGDPSVDIDRAQAEKCTLCGRELPESPVGETDKSSFCSIGCQTVYDTIGDGETVSEIDEEWSGEARYANADQRRSNDTDSREDVTRTFLRIDGMDSITCESFLEAVAEGCDGVTDAEASYVTETIRIDYDPGSISQATLCDALNIAGYTAIPREDAPIDSNVAAEQGERRLESALGYRYAAGVIFGSFLLLPYIVLLYPAHLSSLLGEGALQSFAGGAQFDGGTGALILPLYLVLTGVILFFTGLPLLRGAYVSLKMRAPNAELLTTLTVMGAYLYSTVAVLLGRTDVYFDLTIVIAAIVVAAIFYESLVKQRAMDLLTNLTLSQIDEARRYEPNGTTKIVAVEDLQAGDRILVREGERTPVDGILTTGECTVEEAVITGESLPIEKQDGDDIVGGSIVTADAAVVSVADRATSSIEQLITTIWNLQSADHGAQRQANRFAARSIPIVVAVAVIIGGARLALDGNPVTSLLVALTVLLVASPWAFGLATPLSVATSIEEAMRRGIVVFDETIFERLRDVDVIIFDKTGTLTTGQMSVIEADASAELLEAAAMLERRASHPAADAIVAEFARENEAADTTLSDSGGVDDLNDAEGEVNEVRAFSSHSTGVEGVVNGTETLVGHPDLFEKRGWSVSDELLTQAENARGFGRLPVLVGRDGTAEGLIVVGDEPRERWDETITRLSEQGIETVVLTGDDEDAARFFGRHPHVDYVFAGVPPSGKTATVRRLQSNRSVTMVGDGTNDAPALAQADLGISLGSGTALASDAADIAIVDDDLTAVETAFDLARAAHRRIRQNNVLALLYNGITIPLAAVNLLNPLLAMAAVLVSSTLLAANSVRALLDS